MNALPSPGATLGRARLDVSAPVSWTFKSGTEAHVEIFEMSRTEASKLTVGAPVTLTMKSGADVLEVKDLYVIGETPAQDPHRVAYFVADRRIWWKRTHVFRRYNMRTRSGERRRLDPDGDEPDQIAGVVDDVFWKRYSLKNGREPWKARDSFEDLVGDVEEGFTGNIAVFHQSIVDSYQADDSADSAIARALQLLGPADVWILPTAELGIVNTVDVEATSRQMAEAGPDIVGSKIPAMVKLSGMSPRRVTALFSVEQEVRFDAYSSSATVTGDERSLDNVAPVPDPFVTVRGKKYVTGTLLSFDDLFLGWNADKGSDADSAALPDISHQKIRDGWMKMWLEREFATMGKLRPNVTWVKRILTIRAYYLRLWRMNRRWVDAIHSWRPYRVAILDPETGARAQASVWADYSVGFTRKGLYATNGNLNQDFVVRGGVLPTEKLSAGEAAPAVVVPRDMEQGVFSLDYTNDLLGHVRELLPFAFDQVTTLSAIEWRSRPYYTDGTKEGPGGVFHKLSDRQRTSVVVTVAPGSPNSSKQLYPIDVTPADADEYMPAGASTAGGAHTGPPWDMRIGPGITTARFAWNHAKRQSIEQALGVSGDADNAGHGANNLDDLLQNRKELEALARASAAAIYAKFQDHVEGTKVVKFNPDVKIRGTITQVTHTLAQDGAMTTRIVAPAAGRPFDVYAAMSASARALFQREVQP